MTKDIFGGLRIGQTKTTPTGLPSISKNDVFGGVRISDVFSYDKPVINQAGNTFSERLQVTIPNKFLNPEYQDIKKPVVKLLNYQELKSLAPEEKEQYKNLLKQDIADALPDSTIAPKNNIISKVLNQKYSFNPFSSPFFNKTQQAITGDVVKEVMNTPIGKEAKLSVIENTENAPIKLLSRLGSVKGLELRTDTKPGDTYEEILNKWVDAGTNSESPTWKKFLYQTQSSVGQTGLGVMLNLSGNALIPGAGTALSSAYWAALSGGEQIRRRGEVYSLTNIGIDVALDSWLGNNIEGIFKKGTKDFILKTMAKSGFGEGGTEVAQSFLKYMNDYLNAPTPEAKQQAIQQAKQYVTSGDMFMEFASAFASGAVLGGSGQKVSPNMPTTQTGSIGDQNQEVITPTIPPMNPPTNPPDQITPVESKSTDLIQEAKKYDNLNKFLMSQGALTTDTSYELKKQLLEKADETSDMGEWIDEFSDELRSLGVKNYEELKRDVNLTDNLIKKEKQLTDIWNKAQKTTEPQTKPSKIGKSIEAKAIENNLTKGFQETAGYTPITIKEQSEKASNLVNTDIESARKIVRGEQELPTGLKGTSLVLAMEEYIKNNPSGELAYELANSNLITATSEAGQELRIAAERERDSATAKLLEVKKYREQKAEKTSKKKTGEVQKQIKKQTEKINLSKEDLSWNNFLNSIKC